MNDSLNEKIVMACLKARFNSERTLGIDLPASKEAWQSLADFINRHSLAFFFYKEVKQGRIPLTVPEGILGQWSISARKTTVFNTLLQQELAAILHGMQEIKIEPILLKGFALHSLYEDVLARPTSDIDLLISRDDYEKAKDLLIKSGFVIALAKDFRGTLQQYIELQENYCTEITLQKKLGLTSVNIDLHWELDGIYDGSPLDKLFLIDRYPWHQFTKTDHWEQLTFKTLIPEMHFIHLMTHFALHHQYQGAKWFLDLLLFVHCEGSRLNWDFIDGIMKEPDCRKIVGITLRLMEDLGIKLPAGVPNWQHFWNGKALPREFSFFKHRIFSAPSKTGQYLGYVLMPLGFRDKFRVLLYYLFDKKAVSLWRTESDSARIPALLQPFYILYRVLRNK